MMGPGFGEKVAEHTGCMLLIIVIIAMVVGIVLWEALCWALGHPHLFR